MTGKEFDVLNILAANRDKVVPRGAADGRRVGRELVRLDEDARRHDRPAAPEARGRRGDASGSWPFEAWGSASKADPPMRDRLTLAFVLLTVLLLLGAGVVRSYVAARPDPRAGGRARARGVGAGRAARRRARRPGASRWTARFLAGLVGADSRLVYTPRRGAAGRRARARRTTAPRRGRAGTTVSRPRRCPTARSRSASRRQVVRDILGRDLVVGGRAVPADRRRWPA